MTWMVRDKTLSDYLDACRDAAKDLSNFKRDPRYTKILEHAFYKQGLEYLHNIKRDNPQLLTIPGIFDGDEIGNPVLHNFDGLNCSATTLQYIGVLSNLIKLFGPLNGKSIVEIGGGYGGQSLVIQRVFDVNYLIIDLEAPCMLQYAFMSQVNIACSLTWKPESINRSFDLLISNYALSEVKEPLQSRYVEKFCAPTLRGYVTANREIPSLNWGKRSNDIESERKENFIITW